MDDWLVIVMAVMVAFGLWGLSKEVEQAKRKEEEDG